MADRAAPTALILSGGVAHDFPRSTSELARVLGEVSVESAVSNDVEQALRRLSGPGGQPTVVVLNMLRWTMQNDRYAEQRAEWSISLSPTARAALLGYVSGGGGLLAMHGASICFDDWPEWLDLLGGVWRWDRSSHPPLAGPVRVSVATGAHPVVAGVTDFEVVDEVYGFLEQTSDVRGLMHSTHGGTEHPLLWVREVGEGRVVYDALGHDTRSYDVAEHRRIVQRAALWAAGCPLPDVTG